MKLLFRPADPTDVATLVELYDHAYRGGYSACFDRYGPATPQDFWWVQSEKAVSVIEVNRKPAGLLVTARSGKRLLAEEIILNQAPGARDAERVLRQLHEHLTRRFQDEHQDVLAVRGDETNAVLLAMVAHFGFAFTNALVVASGGAVKAAEPDGYHVRRAQPAEILQIARLHEETLGVPVRPKDLDAMWKTGEARVFVAERENYPAGFALAHVRDGVGRWTMGVREPHRGRRVGSALVHQVLQFFHAKGVPPLTIYWAVDAAAAAFARRMGARTERTYLYFERPL